uniref:Photosystem II cytochrome b559 alpha subunit lumenal region domain-containing protein n=1 Tax=Physcomitrium patens TaxID=3218 RepID=A0A2K1KG40_PHYPA|nr:hypothetical protein PHYPA_009108 [Physcomitrium patens]
MLVFQEILPPPNEHFTESRQAVPLITRRLNSLQQVDELT